MPYPHSSHTHLHRKVPLRLSPLLHRNAENSAAALNTSIPAIIEQALIEYFRNHPEFNNPESHTDPCRPFLDNEFGAPDAFRLTLEPNAQRELPQIIALLHSLTRSAVINLAIHFLHSELELPAPELPELPTEFDHHRDERLAHQEVTRKLIAAARHRRDLLRQRRRADKRAQQEPTTTSKNLKAHG